MFRIAQQERTVLPIGRVTIALLILAAPASAQPCNPVIDGTYCATNSSRSWDRSTGRPTFAPMETIGDDLSTGADPTGADPPATLGAITFRGNGTRCIGLLRRGACS